MLKQSKGCKVMVVVTTRDEGIANEISIVRPYNLPQLSDEMCWQIMSQKSKFETRDDKERLEPIGRDIAKKCKGVALAAQSLGHILRSKSYGEWNSVRTNHIWNLSTSTDASSSHEVLGSLLLSYNLMPPYLKLCFAYCAIFPKGHKMIKDELIHQWIALGFMEPSSIFSYWQLGESYIVQLLEMSFLQHSKAVVEWYDTNKIVTLFTMHDLVHDLARSVMADEFDLAGPNCRYAWNIDCTKPLKSSKTSPEKLRALNIVGAGNRGPPMFHRDAIVPAKYIRVLHATVNSNRLFVSISQLKQLRYLNAPNIHGPVDFGCIGMLQKLNYLNLRHCEELSALPDSIGEMEGLMYLNLSGCPNLKELPDSFADLKELVYLNLSNSDNVLGLPNALADLTKLQQLELTACRTLRGRPDVIINLTELRYLRLSGCMHHIFDSSSTDQTESFIDSICRLPNMEHLDLSFNGHPLISIPENASCLRKLVLHGCRQVARLPECVAKMDRQILFGLLPLFSITTDDGKCYSNLGFLEHVNPHKLNIKKLENVKSPEEARSVRLIEKHRIEEMSLMWNPQAERSVDDMELLRELVPPTTLQKFEIYGYISASFPDWVMSIGNYPPNLDRMEMYGLPNCKSLPPLAQLPPNLRVLTLEEMECLEEWNTTYCSGEDGVNELMLCKLEQVNIHFCPKLRITPHLPRAASWSIRGSDNVLISWAESVSHNDASSSFSGVSTTLIVGRSKVPLHQWRLPHHIPALIALHTYNCWDLTSSPEITWALQSLKSLKLDSFAQSKLSEWVGELASVQQLTINRCMMLEELPGNMRQLKQLQSLKLNICCSLRQLPLWLGELTSLKKLIIWKCSAITTLPNSIQQLTNLQELEIHGCPNLEQWCEAEENKPKLAHIEKKIWQSTIFSPKRAATPASCRCSQLRWPLLRKKIRK
ncbi:hypothetical protein VPH35_069408 [Triticum aestivum]|uniref:Uncharacterized protein n=1 Tax=Triticum aestivum TaxID=4565 RepID=A0A3B6U2H5_WHEAT